MKSYVLGFIFEAGTENILLIEKNRPTEQAGKLNGIGGKIESGESPEHAIIREVEEETGLNISKEEWLGVTQFGNEYFTIHVFTACIKDISLAYSRTDELVSVHDVNDVLESKNCVENTKDFLLLSRQGLYERFHDNFPVKKKFKQ